MGRYIFKRLLWMIPIILSVAILVFTLMTFCPGKPEAIILGSTATEADLAALREELGLNRPFLVRLGSFLEDTFLHFDLGESYITKVSYCRVSAPHFCSDRSYYGNLNLFGTASGCCGRYPSRTVAGQSFYGICFGWDFSSQLLAGYDAGDRLFCHIELAAPYGHWWTEILYTASYFREPRRCGRSGPPDSF